MLRRCMTPKPNTNNKILQELMEGSSHKRLDSRKINYDSFIYIDRLTNKKIAVSDIKANYDKKPRQSDLEDRKKAQQLMNSTKEMKKLGATMKQREFSQDR